MGYNNSEYSDWVRVGSGAGMGNGGWFAGIRDFFYKRYIVTRGLCISSQKKIVPKHKTF